MVKKWAVGAMINISGSIAINLGTNLMKLSHKLEETELASGSAVAFDSDKARESRTPRRASAVSTETATVDDGGCVARSESTALLPSLPELESSVRRPVCGDGNEKCGGVEMAALRPFSTTERSPRLPNLSSCMETPRDQARAEEGTDDPGVVRFPPTVESENGDGAVYEGEPFDCRLRDAWGNEDPVGGLGSQLPRTRKPLSPDRLRPFRPARTCTPKRERTRRRIDSPGGRWHSRRGERTISSRFGDVIRCWRSITASRGPRNGSADVLQASDRREEHRNGQVKEAAAAVAVGDAAGSNGSAERLGTGTGTGTGKGFRPKSKVVWYCGSSLLVVGSLINFASFGFAPQSLLACLGSVQFVSNVIFGKVILREMVTPRVVFGTATIILGNTLTLCFTPYQDTNYDTHQLRSFYDVDYKSLLCMEVILALGMHVLYMWLKKENERGKMVKHAHVLMPVAYAICSAIVGTQSVVQAKCLSELLSLTFKGENQLRYPFTYMVLVAWLGSTVFWLMRMNSALAMFHGLFIIPALQVFWTFFSVLGGGVYFKEFETLRAFEIVGFATGVLVVFLGVYLLAPRSHKEHARHGITAGITEDEVERLVAEAVDGDGDGDDDDDDLRRMLELEEQTKDSSSLTLSPRLDREFSRASVASTRGKREGTSSLEAAVTVMTTAASAAAAADIGDGGDGGDGDGDDDDDDDDDWRHTRMLSLGFFPSVSTDKDVGYLADPLHAVQGIAQGRLGMRAGGKAGTSPRKAPHCGRGFVASEAYRDGDGDRNGEGGASLESDTRRITGIEDAPSSLAPSSSFASPDPSKPTLGRDSCGERHSRRSRVGGES